MIKKNYVSQKIMPLVAAWLLAFGVCSSQRAVAQAVIGTGLTYAQNFDALGNTATAALPAGWKIETGATPVYSSNTSVAAGTSGTGVVTTSTSGAVNFGNGITSTATDRAIGFVTSTSFSAPRKIRSQFQNASGGTITSISVSFDYEKYRLGNREIDWTLDFSTDSTNWTAVPAGNQVFPADASIAAVNPPATTSKTGIAITGISIPDGTFFYLRWTYTQPVTAGFSLPLAIDNFSLTATASAGCTAPAQVTFGAATITTSSIGLSWSALANNVLIVRRAGSDPTGMPASGTSYTAGTALGAGDTVVYAGSSNAAALMGLLPATHYYFRAYSFDPTGSGGNPCYNLNSPSSFDVTTTACLATQVTSLTATATPLSTTQHLGWTLPAGASVIILRKQGAAAITDVPAMGVVYAAGNVAGASTVAYVGADTAADIAGLTANTQYQYAAFAYDPTGYAGNPCYVIAVPATASSTTAVCNGATQVASFSSGVTTTGTVSLSWGMPAAQVIILKRNGAAVSGVPVNGTVYNVGSVMGTQDKIVYKGSGTAAVIAGLMPSGNYYFKAYAFDPTGNAGNTPCYNVTNAPALGPVTTQSCTAQQISNLAVSNPQGTTAGLSWTIPAGLNVIVLKQAGTNTNALTPNTYPVSGRTYNVGDTTGFNSSFGYLVTVAYVGSAAGATIAGLTPNSQYRVQAFAYNPTGYDGGTPCYNLAAPDLQVYTYACNSAVQPTASFVTASNIGYTSLSVNWGTPANNVLIVKGPAVTPVQGVTYTVGSVIGSSTVVYAGSSSSSLSLGGLLPNTSYTFSAVAYDPTGYTAGTPCYNAVNIPTYTFSTASCAPGVTSATAAGTTGSTTNLSWVTTATSKLVLMRAGTAIDFNSRPVSGTAYTAGQTIGANTVAYIGNGNTATIAALNPSSTYYFAVFSFDSTAYNGGTPCYNASGFATAAATTATCVNPTAAPSLVSFTYITATSVLINWTNGNGNKRVVVMNTANTFTAPVNGTDAVASNIYAGNGQQVVYNDGGNSVTVTGLTPGTLYYAAVYEGNCNNTNVHFNTTAAVGNNATILAVQLLSFTAANKGRYNEVKWVSATEDAGDRYQLQRSSNGSDFATIAKWDAKGKAATYSYNDESPVDGTNYYRLKMDFVNGVSVYSNVATAQVRADGFSIAVYPNPVKDRLHIQLYNAGENATLRIVDISGRVLNTVKPDAGITEINTNQLVPGYYFIEYADNLHKEVIKLTK